MAGNYIRRKIKKLINWLRERPYYIRRWIARKRIRRRDFTIISNNCWAGRCYQYLGMPYLSPTVGLYFFAEDYLKFVSDLRYYLSLELEFIKAEESKYFGVLKDRSHTEVPIGKLDDVEIVFLHYKREEEAREKWERRKTRVNFDDVFLKFSKMNGCTEEELRKFSSLNFENKFMLNNVKRKKYLCEIYLRGPGNAQELFSDTSDFPGNIRLPSLLNKKERSYPEEGLIKEVDK